MSDSVQDTVFNSVTDNLVKNFFDGGASSKNVLTPGEDAVKKEEPIDINSKDKPVEAVNSLNFGRPAPIKAEDFIADVLKDKDSTAVMIDDKGTPIVEPDKTVEPVEKGYNFLVESKILAPFEDDAPIKTKKDLESLIKANRDFWETEAREKAMAEYQEAFPEEMKFLMDYVKKGGNDLKGIFKLLGQSQEVRDYNTETPEDQKSLVRAYYKTQNWSEDEIEDELLTLIDDKRLQSRAEMLKPKLERHTQAQLETQRQRQEQIDQDQKRAREFFTSNVVDVLKKGKINEIALNREQQADIYNALVKERYDSISGPTNRLGALLDKIQYVEPDYQLLAEVTMLLSDPVEYKKRIREQLNTDVTADTVKKIKIEQNKARVGSAHNVAEDTKKMPRLGSNFINPFE